MIAIAKRIENELAALGTEERATKEKAYLKSDLVHLGVPVPQIRSVAKPAAKELEDVWPTIDALWARGIYELRMAAVEILLARKKQLTKTDLPRVERLLRDSRTWALVDALAVHVAGAIADARTLDRWAKDDDFWIRRSALLALLVPLRRGGGDFERFGRYADAMLAEKEFFIRKAIGWVLRETSRKQPDLVFRWLQPRWGRASGVTRREAIKYLTERQRLQLTA